MQARISLVTTSELAHYAGRPMPWPWHNFIMLTECYQPRPNHYQTQPKGKQWGLTSTDSVLGPSALHILMGTLHNLIGTLHKLMGTLHKLMGTDDTVMQKAHAVNNTGTRPPWKMAAWLVDNVCRMSRQ